MAQSVSFNQPQSGQSIILNTIRADNKKIARLFANYLNRLNNPTASAASVQRAYNLLPARLILLIDNLGILPQQYDDLLNRINEGKIAFSSL